MAKVLIVDDEIYVCELVKHLIHWEALGLEPAGIAYSADDAISLIQEQQPEIIISDIKMPGQSGFDLISITREINPDCNFILISGHKNFEYAHDALKFNVKDYILKPINEIELNTSLEKIATELRNYEQQRNRSAALNSALSQNLEKLEDSFIRDAITGALPKSPADAAVQYSLQFTETVFNFWIIRVDVGKKNMHRSSPQMLYQKLKRHYKAQLSCICNKVIISILDAGLVAFINYSPDRERDLPQAANKLMALTLDTVSTFADASATIGIGQPVSAFPLIEKSYDDALKCIYARVKLGCNHILHAADYANQPLDVAAVLPTHVLRSFTNAIETLDHAAYHTLIDQMFLRIDPAGHPAQYYIICEFLLSYLETIIRTHLEISNPNFFFQSIHKYLDYATDVLELKQVMLQHIGDVLQQNLDLRNKRGKEVVAVAKSYIAAHYQEPIRLEDVSRQVYLNPSYFSTLFKKETSESFVDYLTHFRMEQAKKLLHTSDASIAEIGCLVGISNSQYFSKLFTKIVGLKPSVYRNLYR